MISSAPIADATGKRVAIVQSNYIPWKGYFDLINLVDEFVLYDDVQYTRRDWRNRNKIKTKTGVQWLTIPVSVKGKFQQAVEDTLVNDPVWAVKHWNAIVHSYSKAPYFKHYRERFEVLYLNGMSKYLSEVNFRFIAGICEILGIKTRLSWSTDYHVSGSKTERLVALCEAAGASEYLSGPAAKDYMQDDLFREARIDLRYMDYSGYPTYRQLHDSPFEHKVSVVDLLFSEGPNSPLYMKSFDGVSTASPPNHEENN